MYEEDGVLYSGTEAVFDPQELAPDYDAPGIAEADGASFTYLSVDRIECVMTVSITDLGVGVSFINQIPSSPLGWFREEVHSGRRFLSFVAETSELIEVLGYLSGRFKLYGTEEIEMIFCRVARHDGRPLLTRVTDAEGLAKAADYFCETLA